MKSIGFLSFGHWTPDSRSHTRSAADALAQSIELIEPAVAAEALGADGGYCRVHHFARQLASPIPLLAAIGARTRRLEIGTAVIDVRYENPLYKDHESNEPFHAQQADQIRAYRAAFEAAGHARTPRVSVSRSIFALTTDEDRRYFGDRAESQDHVGWIDASTRAVSGRTYAAEPGVLVTQLRDDEAITEADTLLLTIPNPLGVDYRAHCIDAILAHVAPALGWPSPRAV